jgi:hypothetical protein
VGSSADPTLNGHLKYPNNLDQSLNDGAADKIRKYRADYNNRPSSAVSFMPDIASTSGRLHSEFVRLLFLQTHRETDRFFAASGVPSTQADRDHHFRRAAFSQLIKSKVSLALAKAADLCINLNSNGALSIASKSHTQPSHSMNFSFVNLVFICRCSSSTTDPVCVRRVNLLVCSLPLHRHSYIGFHSFRSIDS